MKRITRLFILGWIICSNQGILNGQLVAAGARSIAMGGISAPLEDAWASANNPASLAAYTKLSVAISAEQRFLIKELGQYCITTTIPAGKGCFGIFGHFTGYESYLYQQCNLSYGRVFGDNIKSGISLVYVYQKIQDGWINFHQVSYQIGINANIARKVKLAFLAFNPFQIYYKNRVFSTLPSIFKLGLEAEYSESFYILAEIVKEIDYSPEIKIGAEYSLKDKFLLRGGINIWPARFSFGTSIRYKSLIIDLSAWYHQYLGFTPITGFQVDLR
jgi:hypothetical protein